MSDKAPTKFVYFFHSYLNLAHVRDHFGAELEREELLRWALSKRTHHHATIKDITSKPVKLCAVPSARMLPLGSAGWTSTAPSLDLARGACSKGRRRGQLCISGGTQCSGLSPSTSSLSPSKWGIHILLTCLGNENAPGRGLECFSGALFLILFPTHTSASSSGAWGVAGQVMPGHSVNAPTVKCNEKTQKPVWSKNQRRLKCTVVPCRAALQQLSTHTAHGSVTSYQTGKTCS